MFKIKYEVKIEKKKYHGLQDHPRLRTTLPVHFRPSGSLRVSCAKLYGLATMEWLGLSVKVKTVNVTHVRSELLRYLRSLSNLSLPVSHQCFIAFRSTTISIIVRCVLNFGLVEVSR
jgi:hypothetical protein